MLPHEPSELRKAVRDSIARGSNTSVNFETFSRSVEIIAMEARAAGIRAALDLVSKSRQRPDPDSGVSRSCPMRLYLEGYDHAVSDVVELLQLESEDA